MPSTNPAYQKVVSRNESAVAGGTFDNQPPSVEERLLRQTSSSSGHRMMSSNEREEPGHIPQTNSSEELMPHGGTSSDSEGGGSSSCIESGKVSTPSLVVESGPISRIEMFTVFVLCFVNLINYMDRLTIAGVLPEIQSTFDRGNSDGGLLQTVFVISYMICAPAFGYLGDRYSRRWIMILGVALWSGTTLAGSFMQSWGWFMTFRALVGIGEASYSTIAPTIISDLFTHNMRSKMLACFYFAIPVGSGLGYMIGSETAKAFGDWRYALRVTPFLGLLAVILIYFCKEPERGENEGSGHMEPTSYTEDLKDLCKNRSFMYSTLGFTCVAFVTGGLSWWGPTFMHLGVQLQPGNENVSLSEVSLIFGGITLLSGIVGVPLGSILSQRLKKRFPRCDPLICCGGLFVSCFFVFGAMIMIQTNMLAAFLLMFFGVLSMNLNWAIVGDILLYVVVPTRRSTAEAFQILISHMFGDAGSPYLVGLLSTAFLRVNTERPPMAQKLTSEAGLKIYSQLAENATSLLETTTNTISTIMTTTTTTGAPSIRPRQSLTEIEDQFTALQYALFVMCFVEVLGAALFFITSFYVVRDKKKVDQAILDCQQSHYVEDSTDE